MNLLRALYIALLCPLNVYSIQPEPLYQRETPPAQQAPPRFDFFNHIPLIKSGPAHVSSLLNFSKQTWQCTYQATKKITYHATVDLIKNMLISFIAGAVATGLLIIPLLALQYALGIES